MIGSSVVQPDAAILASGAKVNAAHLSPPRLVAALAFGVEAVLLGLLAAGRLPVALFLVGHLLVIAALGFFVRQLAAAGNNTTAAVILGIAVAATGPIGALGGLIAFLLPRRQVTSPRLLRDWYSRIALSADVDQITRLCDDVTAGRHVGLDTPPPLSFVAVLERGSLANRQAALGLMARHIKPDYLPALKAALQSSEPVIRVQAAAVATKIRPELRALVDKAVAGFEAGRIQAAQALVLARDLQSCVDCGLLDAGDRIRAEVMIPRLQTLGATAPVGMAAVSPVQEAALLSAGRFRELRVARRIAAARGSMGRVRQRVVGAGEASRRELGRHTGSDTGTASGSDTGSDFGIEARDGRS
jgi:hypothetical protein